MPRTTRRIVRRRRECRIWTRRGLDLEDADQQLLALCEERGLTREDVAYESAITAHLLRGTMTEIARDHIDGPFPIRFAFVAPDNPASHRLLEAHGFWLIAPRRRGEDTIRYRPGGLEMP